MRRDFILRIPSPNHSVLREQTWMDSQVSMKLQSPKIAADRRSHGIETPLLFDPQRRTKQQAAIPFCHGHDPLRLVLIYCIESRSVV
jgi:hypothetical protein